MTRTHLRKAAKIDEDLKQLEYALSTLRMNYAKCWISVEAPYPPGPGPSDPYYRNKGPVSVEFGARMLEEAIAAAKMELKSLGAAP